MWSQRMLVASLGLVALGVVLMGGLLTLMGHPIPEGLAGIGSAAVGALAVKVSGQAH